MTAFAFAGCDGFFGASGFFASSAARDHLRQRDGPQPDAAIAEKMPAGEGLGVFVLQVHHRLNHSSPQRHKSKEQHKEDDLGVDRGCFFFVVLCVIFVSLW